MLPRSSSAKVLIIGYLVVLSIASIQCDGGANEDSEKEAGGGSGGPLGNLGLGNFGNLGDAAPALSGMFKSMSDSGNAALTDFMSSFSGGPKVVKGEGSAGKREGKENGNNKNDGDGFMGIKDPMDFFKLMLDPMEFMNRLAKQFKLDRGELTQAVGRGMNLGLETALQPPMVCIKIIEKVFVPDACKLKFICEMGKQMAMFKSQMPKFPDSYFEGASTAKALYDGASGRECEHVYSNCDNSEGPKLKKEFAGLKQSFSGRSSSEHDSGEYTAAASQQSRVRVAKLAASAAHRSW